MIKTFKETITSLKDKHYGSVIIAKPLKQVIWYWTQYFLLVSAITVLLVIAVVTYFAPQLPKLLQKNLPDATFSVKDGRFSTTLTQPAVYGTPEFPIIVNTAATDSSALANSPAGILLMSDKFIVKQDAGTIQTQSLSGFPNFSFVKNSVVSWILSHQVSLWLGTCLAILLISVILSALFWVGRMFGFAVWGLVFWFISKILKYPITYLQCVELVLYASVIPLLLSTLLALAPNEFLSFINLGAFLYFGLTWLITLSRTTKNPEPVISEVTPAPKKRQLKTK